MNERIIGSFEGRQHGPLLICIGGMHGNEHAGIEAIEEVLRLLEEENNVHPDFIYSGTFYGLRGNLKALAANKRFLSRDLNRMLIPEEIASIRALPKSHRSEEDKECLELIDQVSALQDKYNPSLTLILDLHTTTATGGVFSIVADDSVSLELAKGLHVPIILGIAAGLNGTTIQYFNRPAEKQYCVVFEAGQHEDPESVRRTVSAIVNCMRTLSAVDPVHVDLKHDDLLRELADGMPKVTRLNYHYKIANGESFVMKAGFQNFDKVMQGQVLASNQQGK